MEREEVKNKIKGMRIREVRKLAINLILKQQKHTRGRKIRGLTKEQVLKRDNNECILCNDKEDLQVHHFKPKLLRKDEKDGIRVTLCKYCHWYLHANPKYTIHSSNLIKAAMRKTNEGVYSYKGNKWGRRHIEVGDKILRLRATGKTMREIQEEVFYWDKDNHKKFVSIGYIHKILEKNKEGKNIA